MKKNTSRRAKTQTRNKPKEQMLKLAKAEEVKEQDSDHSEPSPVIESFNHAATLDHNIGRQSRLPFRTIQEEKKERQLEIAQFTKACNQNLGGQILTLEGQLDGQVYILSFDLEEPGEALDEEEQTDVMMLTITNGFDKLYRVEMSFDFMSMQRQQSQIEGSWHAYFDLLVQALKGGEKNLKVVNAQAQAFCQRDEHQNYQTQASNRNYVQSTNQAYHGTLTQNVDTEKKSSEIWLEIFYPLGLGARIKGRIPLNQFEVKGMERHLIIQRLFIQTAQKLQTSLSHKPADQEETKENPSSLYIQKQPTQLNATKKRPPMKFNSIVVPGMKKRKAEGAKFVNKEVELE